MGKGRYFTFSFPLFCFCFYFLFRNLVYLPEAHSEKIAEGCTSERSKLNSENGNERQEVIVEQRHL